MGVRKVQEEVGYGCGTGIEAVEFGVSPVFEGWVVLDNLGEGMRELFLGLGLFQEGGAAVLEVAGTHSCNRR